MAYRLTIKTKKMKVMKTLNHIILVACCLFGAVIVNAQNKPLLSETGPQSGTISHTEEQPVDFNPSNTAHNFVREWTPQKKITSSTQISETAPSTDVSQQTSYVDGLGRHLQTNQRFGASTICNLILINDVRVLGNKSIQYLPYSINQAGAGANQFQPNAFTDQEGFYNTYYPDEGDNAYSRSQYEAGSGNTGGKVKSYAPGKSFTEQDRGSLSYSKFNTANDHIKIWSLSINNLPVTTSEYGANELIVKIGEGQHDAKAISYTDRYGKLICTKVQSGTASSPTDNVSYYVYDKMDRLVYTLSPKAVEKIAANGWLITNNASDYFVLDHLCSRVDYDDIGRVKQKHIAGQNGDEAVVYDQWHRPVMTQDPELKDDGKWLITIYDKQGRGMMTALLSSTEDAAYWQYLLDGTGPSVTIPSGIALFNKVYTYLINTFNPIQGDNGGLYPTTIDDVQILSYNYYDHYNYTELNGLPFDVAELSHLYQDAYTNTYGDYPTQSNLTHGMLTGSRVRIIKPDVYNGELADWVTSVIYYDKDGRIIQSSQHMDKINSTPAIPDYFVDISTVMYDFRGRVLRSILAHKRYQSIGNAINIDTKRICERYTYETVTFKLRKVEHKIDNQIWQPLSVLLYDNITGALKTKTLGGVENQNYSYDINGQLTGINKDYAETGIKTGVMTFGQSLKRNYGFTEKRYDGTISGNIWITPSHKSRSYGYDYDRSGQVLKADFTELNGTNHALSADWYINTANNGADFSVSNITYDANGNIKTLSRKGPDGTLNSLGAGIDMDILSYTYANNGVSNALDKVDDAATAFNFPGLPDFRDGNTTGADYSYDKNNNLITDANKGISNAIEYTYLDKPQKVNLDGTIIEYTYTAGGGKLEELTYDNNIWTKKIYEGNFIYENDVLQLIGHSEGRLRPDNNAFVYDFFVRDHLGNVRTTVTAKEVPFVDYLATHEVAYSQVEEVVFEGIGEVRGGKPGPSNGMAAELDGDDAEKRVGTSLLLHVMAGDKFNISADAYYSSTQTPGDQTSSGDMLSSVLGVLLGNASEDPGEEGGPSEVDIVNGTFSTSHYNTYDAIKNALTDNTKPRAYINYVVFDENYKVVPSQSGAIQLTSPDTWQNLQTNGDITIQQGGYLAVYISNESQSMTAWFDDVNVKFYRGTLLDENHYYPYGMVINTAHDPNTNPQNIYLYQTKELNKTAGQSGNYGNLYWNDFHARQYDAQLGRFTTHDPMGQFHSGFVGMGNNPVSMIDPDGMWTNWAYLFEALKGIEHMSDKVLITSCPDCKDKARVPNAGTESVVESSDVVPSSGYGVLYSVSSYGSPGSSGSAGSASSGSSPAGSSVSGSGDNSISTYFKRKQQAKDYANHRSGYGTKSATSTSEYGPLMASTGDQFGDAPKLNSIIDAFITFDGVFVRFVDNRKPWTSFTFQGGSGRTINDDPEDQIKKGGPIPEGKYKINLSLDPSRIMSVNFKSGLANMDYGMQKINAKYNLINGEVYEPRRHWGTWRARLEPLPGTNVYGRNRFYFHNPLDYKTIGCIAVNTGLYDHLLQYRKSHSSILVIVKYRFSKYEYGKGTRYDRWNRLRSEWDRRNGFAPSHNRNR